MSRVERLRQALAERDLECLIVTQPENRRYIAGFTGSAGTVVVTADKAVFMTDFRYQEQAKAQCPGFDIVIYQDPVKALRETLSELCVKRAGIEADDLSVQTLAKWRSKIEGVEWVETAGIVAELRARKDPGELACLREAARLADEAFRQLLERIHAGQSELDVALDLEFTLKRLGSERLAFPSIVASGPNSALPHAEPSQRRLQAGDFLTLDFGAVYKGYHSDMTRTVAIGSVSNELRAIYDLVLKAQEVGLAAVRPGRTGREVDADARAVIDAAGHKEHFGHGLGHGVGLAIHEGPPVLSPLSELGKVELAPSMVVSVEPGVYVPGVGGVRIEDLVVVTDSGCDILSKSPKSLLELA